MPDVNIQIPQPIITPPEKFKFRYRILPGGVFSAYQDEDNDAFTLTGLSEGEYEYEALFVTEEGIECTAVSGNFTVVAEPECLEFTVQQIIDGGVYYLEISYTFPSPFVNFPCGYNIYYRPVGTTLYQNLGKPNLPASPLLIQIDPATDYDVIIRGNSCNNTTICFEDTIPAAEPPACIPITVTSVDITPTATQSNGDYKVLITINYTQSTPGTTLHNIAYSQTGMLAGNSPATGTLSVTVPSTNTSISFGVFARYRDSSNNPVIAPPNDISFQGTITDTCGQSHYWSGTLEL